MMSHANPLALIAATVPLILIITGCSTGNAYEVNSQVRTNPDQFHKIVAMRLDEQSLSEPISVEQAATSTVSPENVTADPDKTIEISLQEVRAAALENNLDLQVELVNPSIAQQQVHESEARFEALLFGNIRHNRSESPSSYVEGTVSKSESTSADLGIEIPLRTGGSVTINSPLSASNNRTKAERESSNAPEVIDPTYTAAIEFSISHPLLRDAGVRTNAHAIRVARWQQSLASARTKLAAIRILASADQAYWTLYASRRELEVRKEQYDLALKQLDQAKTFVEAGAAAEIEIMRAESGVAARLEAVIIADTQVRNRERELKRILNRDDLPIDSPTALVTTTEPNPVGLELDTAALIEYALDHRMETLEMEIQLAIDESIIDAEENASLPLLDFDYSFRMHGQGNDIGGAYHDIGDSDYGNHSIGLRAELPLGNKAAKSRVKLAMLKRLQDLSSTEQRKLAIRQQVFDAVDELRQDWQRILAARQEVILAGRTYEGEKRQFEMGVPGITSTDVLAAAARLAGAQLREIYALSAYEISQIDIAWACGALIGTSEVLWEPTSLD